MYESKIAKLDSQAQLMIKRSKPLFQQMSGLTVNNGAYLNPGNYQYGAYNTNAFEQQRLEYYLQNGAPLTWLNEGDDLPDGSGTAKKSGWYNDPDGKAEWTGDYQQLLELYRAGGWNAITKNKDENGNLIEGAEYIYKHKDSEGNDDSIEISERDYKLFGMMAGQARNDYSTAMMWNQQVSSDYESNVSIWLEAEKARLEAEQDEALEPLNYQQTMWELDKNAAEAKLERIKQEREAYAKLRQEDGRDHAPKFGLG